MLTPLYQWLAAIFRLLFDHRMFTHFLTLTIVREYSSLQCLCIVILYRSYVIILPCYTYITVVHFVTESG